MEVEKVIFNGKEYEYITSCDDEKELNEIDIEETEDLTDVIRYIQENEQG